MRARIAMKAAETPIMEASSATRGATGESTNQTIAEDATIREPAANIPPSGFCIEMDSVRRVDLNFVPMFSQNPG